MKPLPTWSRVLLFLACLAFLGHFILTGLHCFPEGSLSPRWRSYSHLYSYPQFHQGWGLFAPDAQDRHKRLELRYALDGKWSAWVQSESPNFDAHKTWRVGYRSKLYHLNQGVGFHLWRSVDDFLNQEQEAEKFYPNKMGYSTACHYAHAYFYHYADIESCDSVEVRLFLEQPHDDGVEEYRFPICR